MAKGAQRNIPSPGNRRPPYAVSPEDPEEEGYGSADPEESSSGPEDELYDEPDPGEEKPAEPMDEDELQAFLRTEIDEAESVARVLSEERQLLTDRYDGKPYGDEEDGQSQVVTREVRDTIHGILPTICRIFAGPKRVVEFSPRGPEDIELAEQQTDYINYVLMQDNPGFLVLYSAFKDALIRRQGAIKWWWDDSIEPHIERYTGLPSEAAKLLAAEAQAVGAKIKFWQGDGELIDMEVTLHKNRPQVRVMAVPPEELLINGTARCVDSARTVAHRRYATVSELVAMGYEREDVEECAGTEEYHVLTLEAKKRLPLTAMLAGDGLDMASRPVLYIEAYTRIDYDGDGVAELRKICLMGEGLKVVHNEPAIERPFALLCPDPTPHTVFGRSVADLIEDLQQMSTGVLRRMLNSLANAITPRVVVVEGQVNVEDVLNNENSAVIRARQPGMVQPLNVPFVGQEAFPMLQYFQEQKENRTGISKAAAGLDADALQSASKAAVAATINGAHQHIELIARIFAETGIKRLFKGIHGLLARHQDAERVIRLRGKFVSMSPASWSADADLVVHLAAGQTSTDEELAKLQAIAARQEAILQQYGPGNPLVTVAQYRYTLAKMLELSGFPDPSRFFSEVPADWQPPAPQQQETPEMLLAKVQVEQIKADIAMKQADQALKREEMLLQDDRERDKAEADIILRARELELKYAATVDTAQIQAAMQRDRRAEQAAQTMQQGPTQ